MAQDSSSYGEEKLGKVFCDPIHGHVELHPLLVKIIDTPQFQRLRNIKQLGGAYLVYPGASHNRFEHSLGVAHLAGVLVKTLRENQPELKINDRDILCVQIAGLCHDLGHGPFSHLFDQMFMLQACGNANWTHEMVSLKMFEYLVDKNGLKPVMKEEYELHIRDDQGDEDDDLVFIKELILGEPLCHDSRMTQELEPRRTRRSLELSGSGVPRNDEARSAGGAQRTRKARRCCVGAAVTLERVVCGRRGERHEKQAEWPYDGRTEEKSFLYEIVSNKQNGIDVDKFDYFARDFHHTGIANNFNHMRYFKFARVIAVEQDQSSRKHICLRDKEVWNLYDLFHTRLLLHRRVCHHKVTTNVQIMITDALLSAKDLVLQMCFKVGADGTSAEDVNTEAFTMLTDNITDKILKSTENTEGMKKAKRILERIMIRNLYRFLGEAKLRPRQCRKIPRKIPKEKIKALTNKLKRALPENPENHKDFFQVEVISFSYGKEEEDPMKYTYFYKKNDPNKGFTIPRNKVSDFLPDCFLEERIRVYWKKEEEDHMGKVSKAFRDWCNSNGFEMVD